MQQRESNRHNERAGLGSWCPARFRGNRPRGAIRWATLGCVAALATAGISRADEVVYSNLATTTAFVWNASDTFVWDDLQIRGGGILSGLSLVADNTRPVPAAGTQITVQLRRLADSGGDPRGSLLGEVSIPFAGPYAAAAPTLISIDDLASLGIVLPKGERIALGVNFNDASGSMGWLTFDPPTIGASSTAAWIGDVPVPVVCEGIVGHPVPCNFGVELRVADPGAIAVRIDIAPLSTTNRVERRSQGELEVALLSTDDFDALQAAPDTLRFGDPAMEAEGGVPSTPDRTAWVDVDGDGRLDLSAHFPIQRLFREHALSSYSRAAQLSGQTSLGIPFAGTDSVWVVRPK